MSEGGFVECATHGTQPRAHVCRHIVETLDSGVSVGFHWPAEDTSPYPDAWCTACDTAVKSAGGEWTEQVLQSVGVSPLCASCYLRAKDIWLEARSVQ
jgi:hypothetical protein